EVAPLAAGAYEVEDGIEYVAHGGLPRAASGVHGDEGFDERPLLVGQVAGVVFGSHTPFYAAEHPLIGQTLRKKDQSEQVFILFHPWGRYKHGDKYLITDFSALQKAFSESIVRAQRYLK